ncbi:nickel-responsive transcriptional regulator NikR [Lentisalinibacter salinarum]|uniref:nickel-responsive transcriptional regulator NikR n=1 Tax=Lentisalinibacter salinarum TaxID=2992239 RepID=UPI003869F3CA
MSDLKRIGVAIEADLLEEFDRLIEDRGYPSRSEAFRDMIRSEIGREDVETDDETAVVGTVTLVYSHSQRRLGDRLTAMQHEAHHAVIATLHVHLTHEYCMEVIVLRGAAGRVRALADALIATKGVRHGRLTLTAADF